MNLGRRRIKNDELCAHFEAMGFSGVEVFLASGNIIFEASSDTSAALATRIEEGLRSSLGYEVSTFLRTEEEVRRIAAREPFPRELERTGGKIQVALLSSKPADAAREVVLTLETEDDRLAIHGRELFWLPSGNLSESVLDFKSIEAALGRMTVRTKRTVERIVARYLSN
jgi:uncharacterized protein (DUF1697 family)